jgi:hypothetical protein
MPHYAHNAVRTHNTHSQSTHNSYLSISQPQHDQILLEGEYAGQTLTTDIVAHTQKHCGGKAERRGREREGRRRELEREREREEGGS